jgi:Dos2-interacting transcription regulator of RNA-Pol-II
LLRFNITRETLVEALEATFTATPLFAPLFIPLALDKLASSVRHAGCLAGRLACFEQLSAYVSVPDCIHVKLASSHIDLLHRQAKLDALSGLAAAAERFGAAAMRPHIDALWRGLRAELLADAPSTGVCPAVQCYGCAACIVTLTARSWRVVDVFGLNS